MKASGFWQTLQGPRHVYLLHLVLLVTGLSPSDAGHNLYTGVVGGNVSFHCPINTTKKLEFLYFQKVNSETYVFLNGYHDSRPLNPRENTQMDHNNTVMHIYGLNLSDSGEYQCYYKYKDPINTDPMMVMMVMIHLNVTAFFSKPVITVNCNEESGISSECTVECNSYNGLPRKGMKWNVPGNISREMWKILKNIEEPSRKGLVNISSTAYFNCSGSKVMVSCSADGVTSEIISLCSPKPLPVQPDNSSTIVIVAAVVCSLVVVIIFVLLYLRKRTTGTDKGSVVRNMAVNGQAEEVIVLNNIRQEQMG